MPHLKLPSGTEMFYAIPTCTDQAAIALEKPFIDPARPTLLLIHGAASDSRSWAAQIQDPVLNQNFNLVCIDLPLLGLTRTPCDWKPGQEQIPPPRTGEIATTPPIISNEKQAEDCAALVKALRLPPVHIVANGVNTAIAYHLLIHYPDLCKSAIFISPASLEETQHNKIQFAGLWRAFLEHEEHDASEVMQGFYTLSFGPRAGPETERREYWDKIWHTYLYTDEATVYTFGQWASAISLREGYTEEQVKKGFTVPICLASGSEHIVHPTAHADIEAVLKESRACPFYESHWLGMAPTMAQVTHPKEVNRIICKFIARCEGRRHSVYDAEVYGYNKHWDAPYKYLEERHNLAEEHANRPQPIPRNSASKSRGLFGLIEARRKSAPSVPTCESLRVDGLIELQAMRLSGLELETK